MATATAHGGDPQVIERLIRHFAKNHLAATWLASGAPQAGVLQAVLNSSNLAEAGLQFSTEPPTSGARLPGEDGGNPCWLALASASTNLRSSGVAAPTLLVQHASDIAGHEKQLGTLGFRHLVVAGSAQSQRSVRALAGGLWQFGIAAQQPARSWQWLRSSPPWESPAAAGAPCTLVALDVARMGTTTSRGFTRVERLLTQAAWAQTNGQIRVVGLGELARTLSEKLTGQPQRSILRAA
jgi:hypothetical protein